MSTTDPLPKSPPGATGVPATGAASVGAARALRRPKALRLFLQVLAALLVSVLVGLAAAPAQAQIRRIPEEAKLATLKLGVFPDAVLNGRPIKLGPGARIYNQDNIIIVPSTQKDVTNVVAYVTGSLGEVVAVWILKDAEYRQLRARQKQPR